MRPRQKSSKGCLVGVMHITSVALDSPCRSWQVLLETSLKGSRCRRAALRQTDTRLTGARSRPRMAPQACDSSASFLCAGCCVASAKGPAPHPNKIYRSCPWNGIDGARLPLRVYQPISFACAHRFPSIPARGFGDLQVPSDACRFQPPALAGGRRIAPHSSPAQDLKTPKP